MGEDRTGFASWAFNKGRADERTAVVAWLRQVPAFPGITGDYVADAIEKGEHRG